MALPPTLAVQRARQKNSLQLSKRLKLSFLFTRRLKSGFPGLRPTDGLCRPVLTLDGWSAKADHWRKAPEVSEFTRLVRGKNGKESLDVHLASSYGD